MSRGPAWMLALLAAIPASAEAADVEVFGGLGLVFPALDTRYDASYTPSRVVGINQLFEEPDPRSHARQVLGLRGESRPGLGLGVNVYPYGVLGFQLLFDRARVDVTGESSPHEVDLTYDTIAFPTPERVVAMTGFNFESADTEGTLDEQTLSFNIVARFGRGAPVSGSVSGWLSYFRFSAEAEPLGAHAAWLGGHAVLFSELYEMSYETRAAGALGFNVGAQIDVSLGPHLALFADGRLLQATAREVGVELDDIVSNNVVSVPVTQIEDFLALPPLELDPSYARMLFGLKWRP